MIPSVPSKILVGISLDAEESKKLLSWAINVLAQPNDTVLALNIFGQYMHICNSIKAGQVRNVQLFFAFSFICTNEYSAFSIAFSELVKEYVPYVIFGIS